MIQNYIIKPLFFIAMLFLVSANGGQEVKTTPVQSDTVQVDSIGIYEIKDNKLDNEVSKKAQELAVKLVALDSLDRVKRMDSIKKASR